MRHEEETMGLALNVRGVSLSFCDEKGRECDYREAATMRIEAPGRRVDCSDLFAAIRERLCESGVSDKDAAIAADDAHTELYSALVMMMLKRRLVI